MRVPVDGEVLAPEWMSPPAGAAPGAALSLFITGGDGDVRWEQAVTVADTYPLVPTRPD